MTGKEALEIVETYNYWKGGADEIGNICINPRFLEAQRKYDEAKSIIEKQDKILKALKPYIELSSDGIISCHNFIIIPIFISKEHKERYDLLKEWLDE